MKAVERAGGTLEAPAVGIEAAAGAAYTAAAVTAAPVRGEVAVGSIRVRVGAWPR